MLMEIIFLFLLSLVDFFCLVPMILKILLKNVQSLHRHVTSDIPTNAHAFDNCVISLFRTLPEPSNFNIVWTSVPLSDSNPILIEGLKTNSRASSITVYNSDNLSNEPISLDLDKISGNDFLIKIVRDKCQYESHSDSKTNLILCQSWNRCLIAMRNYMIPPDLEVLTPQISSNGITIRPPQTIVTGLEAKLSKPFPRSYYLMLTANIFIVLIMNFIMKKSIFSNLRITFGSFLLSQLYRKICFYLGKISLKKMLTSYSTMEMHKFFLPSYATSAKASQPTSLHKYWFMQYDLRDRSTEIYTRMLHLILVTFIVMHSLIYMIPYISDLIFVSLLLNSVNGCIILYSSFLIAYASTAYLLYTTVPCTKQVIITGKINSKYQKYWSVVVYDEFGIPLSGHVYDDIARKTVLTDQSDNCEYTYDIRLTRNAIDLRSNADSNHNWINVTSAPVGYVLFRIVHPNFEDIIKYSAPTAEFVEH